MSKRIADYYHYHYHYHHHYHYHYYYLLLFCYQCPFQLLSVILSVT